MIGLITDRLPFGRRNRALAGCAFVLFLNCLIWASGLGFQVQFSRDTTATGDILKGVAIPWDWTDGVASGPIVLLMSCTFRLPKFPYGLSFFLRLTK